MQDYRRFVSYIYSYPGGVRDKNVGFARMEVKNGSFGLMISIKGVYTDVPERFKVFVMIGKEKPGKYKLLPTGNILIKGGVGSYNDFFKADNICDSGFSFDDVRGIAISRKDDGFYTMLSLWEDYEITTADVEFPGEDSKIKKLRNSESALVEAAEAIVQPAEASVEKVEAAEVPVETKEASSDETAELETATVEEMSSDFKTDTDTDVVIQAEEEEEIKTWKVQDMVDDILREDYQEKKAVVKKEKRNKNEPKTNIDLLYENSQIINVFDDDYYYDCIEVTPNMLKEVVLEEDMITGNSFLLHGYFNFKHLLFGRVRQNDNNTQFFLGVPGMYCNRERYMASMFGFNNFKKSHRSDYTNPYFGYWYMEI